VVRRLHQYGAHVTLFGMPDKLRLLNSIDEYINRPSDEMVRELYNKASCFISCSQHEGFNLTCLEAMACGCPVVKTKDDGSDEYSLNGSNCIVADSPKKMAEGVMSILSNNAVRDKLSKFGLETASMYPWDSVIDRLEKLLLTT
jgi:L-malate glycosyltransferase